MAVTEDLIIQSIGKFDPDRGDGPLTIRFPSTASLVDGQFCAIFNFTTSATTITLEKSNVTVNDKIMDPTDRTNLVGTLSGLSLPNYGYVKFVLDIEKFPNPTWVWREKA